jgi:hypothetical protein
VIQDIVDVMEVMSVLRTTVSGCLPFYGGRNQWCSPGMLTRGALQKCPELAGGWGGVQYDILKILNFVSGYSSNYGTNIRHYSY